MAVITATNLHGSTVGSPFVTCKDSHLEANLGNTTNGVGFTVACFFVRSTQPSSSAWARRSC